VECWFVDKKNSCNHGFFVIAEAKLGCGKRFRNLLSGVCGEVSVLWAEVLKMWGEVLILAMPIGMVWDLSYLCQKD